MTIESSSPSSAEEQVRQLEAEIRRRNVDYGLLTMTLPVSRDPDKRHPPAEHFRGKRPGSLAVLAR